MSLSYNTVLFRCNASLQIGSGHVMRCMTLAKELFNKGINTVFFTDDGGKKVIEQFAASSIQIELRDVEVTELEQLQAVINKYHASYMVWDSYNIESVHEKIVSAWLPLMIIDDTYLLSSYSCDAILNQNIYAEAHRYNLSNRCTTVLAGSRYAMLRESFRKYSETTRAISATVKKVLITFGGSDPDNLTLKALKTFEQLQEFSLEISIVIGSHYAFEKSIQNHLRTSTYHKYHLYKNITTMAELMREQDCVITASGSTMYELAILGIPSCCIATADNQMQVAKSFSDHGVAIYGGRADVLDSEEAISLFRNILINNLTVRQEMSLAGRRLIDGNGVCRVADYILERMNARACK